jgi:hypothetical protein
VEVILTVEAGDGTISRLSGTGDTYELALTAAEAKIPQGSKTIVIRTSS